MRWLTLALVGLVTAVTPQVAAAGERLDPPACTAANSERLSVAELVTRSERYRGRCIALSAHRIGDLLFADHRDVYHHATRRVDEPRGIIGIPYGADFDGRGDGLNQGIYYGRLESCEEAQRNFRRSSRAALRSAAEGGDIILLHFYGYCASSLGPALRVERAEERPSSGFRRLNGDQWRQRLGELAPVRSTDPHSAIAAWAAQATSDGCGEIADLSPPPASGPREGLDVPWGTPAFGPAEREKVARHCATRTRQRAMFTVSASSPSAEPGTRLDIIACLCLTEDCAGRWPVALIDTGWGVDRPYLCQRLRLVPRSHSLGDDGRPVDFSGYEYQFADDYIVGSGLWQDWGFPEAELPTP